MSPHEPSQHPAGLRLVQSGIITGGAYPVGNEAIHLILHQGDQWRHNDGDTGPVQRRDLVADRLPSPGRHEDKISPPRINPSMISSWSGRKASKPNTALRVSRGVLPCFDVVVI